MWNAQGVDERMINFVHYYDYEVITERDWTSVKQW